MQRREFIAAAAGGVAGALLVGAARAGQPAESPPSAARPRRTLRKAVMIGMVQVKGSLEEKFQALKDCGFEGVEVDCPSKTSSDEILAAQEKTGIKVHGLVDSKHWSLYLNAPDETVQAQGVEALETCLRDGKKYGSSSVLLVPGLVNKNMAYDECWRLSQANIRKALPLARECGVKIAIENVWNGFIMSPLEAARYVDEFNDPMVGWHFDIGNIINFGWPEQWVRILGKRTLKLHIKDYSRKKRDDQGLWKGFDVELGEGDAGWPAVMKALDEVGYSTDPKGNWATAEVGGGDAARLRRISDQMDKIFAA